MRLVVLRWKDTLLLVFKDVPLIQDMQWIPGSKKLCSEFSAPYKAEERWEHTDWGKLDIWSHVCIKNYVILSLELFLATLLKLIV